LKPLVPSIGTTGFKPWHQQFQALAPSVQPIGTIVSHDVRSKYHDYLLSLQPKINQFTTYEDYKNQDKER
jgi:hypothetical protein